MSQKLSPNIKTSTMDFVVNGITHVCNTFKRRAPGTQSERDAQDYFAKELGQWSDKVIVEDFTLRPAAQADAPAGPSTSSPIAYPDVAGSLGDHLRQLQESVAP